jgi:hypothetical protein
MPLTTLLILRSADRRVSKDAGSSRQLFLILVENDAPLCYDLINDF